MVGMITNDMSRLRDEIGASRLARRTFMQKDVANALEVLHKSIVGLRNGVEHMLAEFHGTRTKVMRTSRTDRRAFVADLQDKVVGLRKEVANLRHVAVADLKGAHTAFFGSHASGKPTAGSKRSKGKR
jgi:hypothetical protein